MKWLCLLLISSSLSTTTSFGATLTGIIRGEDARPVSNARVVIYHELTMLFVRRGVSDRNGNYLFNLEPGPYRVWILKEGHQPVRAEATLLHREQRLQLDLDLTTQESERQAAQNLKKILRGRNREPFRELDGPLTLPKTSLTADESLTATVRTSPRQQLDGDAGQRATIEVATQLNDRLTVASSLTNEQSASSGHDTMEIRAGVSLALSGIALDVEAETIQVPDQSDQGYSRALRMAGQFDRNVRGRSELRYRTSEDPSVTHEEFQIRQDLAYRLDDHQLNHEINLTGWNEDATEVAQQATFRTDWKPENRLIGLRSDVEVFRLDDAEGRSAVKMWVTGDYETNAGIKIHSQVGVADGDADQALVQHHRFTGEHGAIRFDAELKDDTQVQAYASRDVYGLYLPTPQTPYANEAFFQNREREADLAVSLYHGGALTSSVSYTYAHNEASLLHTRQSRFLTSTEHRAKAVAYALESTRWGSRLEFRHADHANQVAQFERQGVAYSQMLSPFRSKALGVMLELQMSNQPDIPAWWLLTETPWNIEDDGPWYQGNLSVQF